MKYVFAGLCLGLIVYEIVALNTPVDGDTISEIIWHISKRYPVVPFVGGFVAGHFWWPKR